MATGQSDIKLDPGNILHASCVSYQGNGLLIIGPSGSGKSSLALEMMALGASLVSDDRCVISENSDQLFAAPPESIAGLIEARGVGILKASYEPSVKVCAVLDLTKSESERLPERRSRQIMGVNIPCFLKTTSTPMAAAMMQLLKAGRHA